MGYSRLLATAAAAAACVLAGPLAAREPDRHAARAAEETAREARTASRAHARSLHARAEERRRHEQTSVEAAHALARSLRLQAEARQPPSHARLEPLHARPGLDRAEADLRYALDRLEGGGPRPAAAPQDPADSLWKAARERLNRGDHAAAVRLFERIRTDARFAGSAYRADAFYWQAFSLARLGDESSLARAQEVLGLLLRDFPADQRMPDTNALLATIQVRLAQHGNAVAADRVRALAAPEPARPGQIPRSPSPVVAPRPVSPAADVPGQHTGPVRATAPRAARTRPPQCGHDDAEIALIALNALVRMDTASAMPVLREVLARRDECAAPLRERALMVVARLPGAESESLLAEVARRDPDAHVRRMALFQIGPRNPELAAGIAEESLRTAVEDEQRAGALEVLAALRNERGWRVIREYAGRSDLTPDTRRHAILALGQSGDSSDVAFLRSLWARTAGEPDRPLREAILMAAASRRGGADTEWLMTIARSGNEEARLREFAIALVGRRPEAPTAGFVSIYENTTDRRVKAAALAALADRARDDAVAADWLIGIARSENDAELRKIAIMGLAGSNDPRVRELLIEIVRR